MLLEHGESYVMYLTDDDRAACSVADGNAEVVSDARIGSGYTRITCVKSDRLQMFIDGVGQGMIPMAASIEGTGLSTVLGNNRDGTQPYVGAIDTVRIWNRALTSKDLDETAEVPFEP